MSRVLFVTWDGADQNYLESLFLPIFARVAEAGDQDVSFDVVQFTWAPGELVERTARAAEHLGIGYTRHPVIRRPLAPATAWMIAWGARQVVRAVQRYGSDTLFPRSLIPAAMCLLARRSLPGVRLVFDADGLMADERVDFGGWSTRGAPYRILREVESQAVRNAERVMTRTHAAKRILLDRAGPDVPVSRIIVNPNAKDADAFRPATPDDRARTRREYGVPQDAPWIVYAGSLGPQYHPEEMLSVFRAIRRRRADARFQVMSGQAEAMTRLLRADEVSVVRVGRVPPHVVAEVCGAADLGLALRTPSFSQRGVCPIKIAEYQLCGLPVVATAGVGDTDRDLADRDRAAVLTGLCNNEIERAAAWFVEHVLPQRTEIGRTCRSYALEHFSLTGCVERYRRVLGLASDEASAP